MCATAERGSSLPAGDRCVKLLCSMRFLVTFTFLMLAIFISIIVVGVTTQQTGDEIGDMSLIIDTDAGTDDAMAIMVLLEAQKRYYNNETGRGPHLKAITTVNGNTNVDNVSRNVLRILKMEDKLNIPVYKGASNSILSTPPENQYFGKDGMGDVPDPDPPSIDLLQTEHAAVALVRMAKENPGQLSLVALGPLTNIALAIRLDRNFLKNLKHLFILGGATEGRGNVKPGVEFNFYMDAEANYIVLKDTEYNPGSITLMSYEQIEKMKITQQWRSNVLGVLVSSRITFLNAAEHIESANLSDMWNYADPVLAACVLQPQLSLHNESLSVIPITQGEIRGGIVVDYNNFLSTKPKITLISEIEVDQYKNLLIDYLGS